MSGDVSKAVDDEYSKSQIPEILEWFSDVVENHHTAIIIFFTTMLCLVLSGMIVLRHWIKVQQDAHKNCKGRGSRDAFSLPQGKFGAVIDSQPSFRPLVFSENIPDAVLETMPKQKADVIRLEKEIASTLTGDQRLTEAEVQRQQLEAIYKLMAQNEDKFGESSMAQIYSQASMYGK